MAKGSFITGAELSVGQYGGNILGGQTVPLALRKGAGGFDYYWSGSAAGGGDGSVASPWTAAEVTAKPANFFAGKRLGMLPSTNDAANGNTAITRADASIYLGASNSLGNETDNSLADHITDCSAPLTGTWSNVATNIWQITVTQISDGSASGNILHNGVPGQIVQNRAALTSGATAGLYFVAAWGWQGVAGITSTTSLVIETYSTVDPSGDGITRRYDHASNDNIFKSGVASGAWKVNASTYNTLAALQSGESPADSRSVAA